MGLDGFDPLLFTTMRTSGSVLLLPTNGLMSQQRLLVGVSGPTPLTGMLLLLPVSGHVLPQLVGLVEGLLAGGNSAGEGLIMLVEAGDMLPQGVGRLELLPADGADLLSLLHWLDWFHPGRQS